MQASCASNTLVNSIPDSKYTSATLHTHNINPPPPISSNSHNVSLLQLLDYANASAPAVLHAHSQLDIAKAKKTGATQLLHSNTELSFGVGQKIVDSRAGLGFEVGISQPIEIAGERGTRIDAADANIALASAQLELARWNLHVVIHQLVVQILLAQERIQQAETFALFSHSIFENVQRQVDAGQRSPHVLLVAEADDAATQQLLLEAHSLKRTLETELALILGWPAEPFPTITGQLPPVKKVPQIQSLTEHMAGHHPAFLTEELNVAAKKKELNAANRNRWPTPSIGFSYAQQRFPDTPTEHNWMINLSLPIPIFEHNQAVQAEAAANLQAASVDRDLAAMKRNALLYQAAVKMNSSADLVQIYEQRIVPNLKENLLKLQRAFDLGEVDLNVVSQTRQRLLQAVFNYLDARVSYYHSAAAVEGFIGTELWPSPKNTEPK